MQKLVDVSADPIRGVLNVLLEDKTTGQNVVWGTDAYASKGSGYDAASEIKADALLRESRVVLQPRIEKDVEEQQERTKKRAEVYTPSWLCNKMNNYCDEVWFGRKKVFNVENDDQTWTPVDQPVYFVDKNKRRKIKDWQLYVDSRRLEITCGEAPFLVSRYDAATGELLPLKKRIGILDRKLRVVDENAKTENDWLKWAQRAVESCYGYEYQGDSLLIARINVLLTFYDYYEKRWGKPPTKSLIKKIANIVAWNIWQMDGINDVVPLSRIELPRPTRQPSLFDTLDDYPKEELQERFLEKPSKIKNWRSNVPSFEFKKLKEPGFMKKKMFDFVIGNPPYQEEAPGESTSEKPVYHHFMDAACDISSCVELVTPARFLFNAGATPKEWNKKMLNSQYFQVLDYDADATNYFPNTAITGGIAVTMYDERKGGMPIGQFIPYKELTSICKKVVNASGFSALSDIVSGRTPYLFTDMLHSDHPEAKSALSKGHMYDISSNAFSSLPAIFLVNKPNNVSDYYRVLGRLNNERAYCWILRKYARGRVDEYTGMWKVFLPKANGASGMLGDEPARLISKPVVGESYDIATDTFLCVGAFKTQSEAQALLSYLNSKFARVLLGTLKVTQINAKETWRNVPLQDFTSNSDIDWAKSIPEIDQQLYKKYGLTQDEIEFIETHVKEMN